MTGHQRTISLRSTGDHSRSTECPRRLNEGSLSSKSSSQPNAAHLGKRPFEGDCICCISAIISAISAAWLGIIFVAPTNANLTRLPSTSWFLLASDLSGCRPPAGSYSLPTLADAFKSVVSAHATLIAVVDAVARFPWSSKVLKELKTASF